MLSLILAVTAFFSQDFESRRAASPHPESFRIFTSQEMTSAETEAMKFLYAYMPDPDMADHDNAFYLENVRASLKAREEMPWGKLVPEREWRHFVLPVRVNNEDLDMARPLFYEELKDRVKGMSMTEAALEVNHWCHEKATYRPSDSRTSSPLSTMKQAIGRCGEESTFAVAALRSVGIPARQVYTPRWAHTDDNHAWVEVWTDGKWHFLGACEPEPILDLAWFNAPATRGMLMNTKAFGRYDGPEEVLEVLPTSTVINVTENYAPTALREVKAVYPDGSPAVGATVQFRLYNYAEYFNLASKKADAEGKASLRSGLGDLLAWAFDDKGNFGFEVLKASDTEPVTLTLNKDGNTTGTWEFQLTPPAGSTDLPRPTEEQRLLNDHRKVLEDSIRGGYEATFISAEDADKVAAPFGKNSGEVAEMLLKSRGNHRVLTEFLGSIGEKNKDLAVSLLSTLAEKDLRDVTHETLEDHLLNTPLTESPLFQEGVLAPRVRHELLTPYKGVLSKGFSASLKNSFRQNPSSIVEWVKENIRIDDTWNPLNLLTSPAAVLEWRTTDSRSRELFFVALCRTMGIPARVDAVTGKLQYAPDLTDWEDVILDEKKEVAGKKGSTADLRLGWSGKAIGTEPKYFSHFSVSKIDDGNVRLLEFGDFEPISSLASSDIPLDPGQYILTTGRRLASGGVLARSEIFRLAPGRRTEVTPVFREAQGEIQVIGSFNSENLYHDLATDTDRSLLSATGRGYYALALVKSNHEPSAHALNDIAALAGEFDRRGEKLMVIFSDSSEAARFDPGKFPKMPRNVIYGYDPEGKIAAELTDGMNLNPDDRPVIIVADTFNRIVFLSQGYTIGTGERLLETLSRLSDKAPGE